MHRGEIVQLLHFHLHIISTGVILKIQAMTKVHQYNQHNNLTIYVYLIFTFIIKLITANYC